MMAKPLVTVVLGGTTAVPGAPMIVGVTTAEGPLTPFLTVGVGKGAGCTRRVVVAVAVMKVVVVVAANRSTRTPCWTT